MYNSALSSNRELNRSTGGNVRAIAAAVPFHLAVFCPLFSPTGFLDYQATRAPVQALKSRSNAACFDARTVIRRDDETVFLLVGSGESSLVLDPRLLSSIPGDV